MGVCGHSNSHVSSIFFQILIIPEKLYSEILRLFFFLRTYYDYSEFVELQQVYMYFRGSGKAAEMRREAARGAMRNAF
jgi:hypothetical protein